MRSGHGGGGGTARSCGGSGSPWAPARSATARPRPRRRAGPGRHGRSRRRRAAAARGCRRCGRRRAGDPAPAPGAAPAPAGCASGGSRRRGRPRRAGRRWAFSAAASSLSRRVRMTHGSSSSGIDWIRSSAIGLTRKARSSSPPASRSKVRALSWISMSRTSTSGRCSRSDRRAPGSNSVVAVWKTPMRSVWRLAALHRRNVGAERLDLAQDPAGPDGSRRRRRGSG